ncbi:DUF1254 domain-containing protein [Vulgatibacter incomptus]|uniref:Putative exported protein n=1 Tax=Vulgatibacter incomptus TaxID=1391653 RepID=A0A0K1PI03_9BACT|nr:DUF1254 domain-containing protein [Vulgatibacter incomptus]AKU93173.1 putative exported protein [Vulgatibacter incomptus]
MRRVHGLAIILISVAASVAIPDAPFAELPAPLPPISQEEARTLGVDAYVYGYPIVLTMVTRSVMTNVPAPTPMGRAPLNQLSNAMALPTPRSRDVVSPNVDTLYSVAWLDLEREPMVLHVPDARGRYYLAPVLDAWTNVISSPGKRTTGTAAQDFVIVGPAYRESLPLHLTEIQMPTTTAWIAARFEVRNAKDVIAVNALRKNLSLTPLSVFLKRRPAPTTAARIDASIDMETPPPKQVEAMDAPAFFTALANAMVTNPPAPDDAQMVANLRRLGIEPGQSLDFAKLPANVVAGLTRALPDARTKIAAHAEKMGHKENGWTMSRELGSYGTRYLDRAATALVGFGANVPEDSIYAFASDDEVGVPLDGSSGQYVIRFPKGQMPPVEAFWSVTLYGPDHFLVENERNRYSLGSHDALKTSKDGSIELFVQHEAPKGAEANWIPAPRGPFNLILRMYWPKRTLLEGEWQLPSIRKL